MLNTAIRASARVRIGRASTPVSVRRAASGTRIKSPSPTATQMIALPATAATA